MPIYDVVVGVVVAALAVYGWRRGVVREALELAVLLVGSFVVFRFSPVVGSIIAGMANIPYEVARVSAGVVLFLVLVIGAALVARLIAMSLKLVPGATFLDRLGGAVVGAGYALLLVVLGTTLLLAAPMPDGTRETVTGSVGASRFGSRIVEPQGVFQQTVATVSGERLFSAVLVLRETVGSRLIAGTLPIPLPDIGDTALPSTQIAAQSVFDSLNRTRILEGHDPLGWSGELANVSVARADQVYRSGTLALDSDLADVLKAQGVPGTVHTEMVALAASAEGVAEALVGASAYRRAFLDTQYRKAGVGVIDGPYGLLAVLVLSA